MTAPVADPGLFADASSLAGLKRAAAAHDPQALRAAAQQFESLFIDMMLKSAEKANFKDPLFGSSQQRMYQDLYDQQLSIQMSKTHTFGLAEMLVQQLRRQWASGAAASDRPGQSASAKAATAQPARTPESRSTKAQVPPANRPGNSAPPPGMAGAAGSATSGASAAASGAGVDAAQQTAFARSLWPDAERAAGRLGVSPVALIAQAALETDWGRSMPRIAGGASSNNLFGIKGSGGWSGPSARSGTHEYVNGTDTATQARFRAYSSCGQCFQDYTALLSGDPRYAGALSTGNDVSAFASALQRAGYATDPDYARKLTAVADTLSRTLAAQAGSGPLKLAAAAPINTRSSAL